MNREPDLDRKLDAWLRPGPTVMPDRFLDTVLDRVDRQPQRRLARLLRRFPTVRPMTLLAATVVIGLLLGAGAIAGSRPAPEATVATPAPSMVAPSPVASPTAAPTRSPSPAPTKSPPPTSLTTSFDSPSFVYSLMTPEGFALDAATEPWDPYLETDMASPWLEQFRTADFVQIVSARSIELDEPLDTEAWLDRFLSFPGSPTGGPTCTGEEAEWTSLEVDGRAAFELHEHCGPTWLVVSTGDRGYVFTWRPQIDDTPEMRALYDPVWTAIRGSIDLDGGE